MFRIRISFYADPDPGSWKCTYGSRSRRPPIMWIHADPDPKHWFKYICQNHYFITLLLSYLAQCFHVFRGRRNMQYVTFLRCNWKNWNESKWLHWFHIKFSPILHSLFAVTPRPRSTPPSKPMYPAYQHSVGLYIHIFSIYINARKYTYMFLYIL